MKQENKGSALILILIAMFLITTLGLAILSVSIMNLEMKTVDRKSKENFYCAETALDEIEVGLEELVTKQIKESYTQVLENYSTIHPTRRTDKFREYLRYRLCAELTEVATPTLSQEKLRNLLDSYVIQTPKYSDATKVGVSINELGEVQPYVLLYETYAMIHDVYIIYREQGYETVIQTDIKIAYPEDVLFDSAGLSGENDAIGNYALIADKGLEIATNQTTSLTNIVGNIYAGEYGISMGNQGTMVNISASEIVTRGDITVKDKARLYISGNGMNRIWAKNIISELSNATEALSDTVIDIHGNCYIYNDLLLNAKRSNVKLNGTYMGYRVNQLLEADGGSAIIVNGKNSTLDLSKVSELVVAGNASIQVPSATNSQIMTGDSITMKGNQIAYLVPESCISVGHNPVLWSEYSKGITVDITKDASIRLADYVDGTGDEQIGYRTVFYKMNGGVNVVYYYLDFTDGQKAYEYMLQYKKVHPESFDAIRATFPVNKMDFSYGTTKSSGTATRIKEADRGTEILEPTSNRRYLENIESSISNKYLWMTRRLTEEEDARAYLDESSLANSFVDMNRIKQNAGNVVGKNVYTPNALDTYSIQIIYNGKGKYAEAGEVVGTEVVVNTPTRGILVATGDVKINADFTGLLIAGGNVTIASNASVYADALVAKDIWNRADETINQYFYDTAGGAIIGGEGKDSNTQKIDISNLISYQNWRKN